MIFLGYHDFVIQSNMLTYIRECIDLEIVQDMKVFCGEQEIILVVFFKLYHCLLKMDVLLQIDSVVLVQEVVYLPVLI